MIILSFIAGFVFVVAIRLLVNYQEEGVLSLKSHKSDDD